MPFPNTDWPTSVDIVRNRIDGVSIVTSTDFEYQDDQIRTVQTWLGASGAFIGAGISGAGASGIVSPQATGSVAFTIAARQDFTSGTLLSVGDDYNNVYTELFSIEYNGQAYVDGNRVLTEDSGEFASITEKATPVSADVLLLEDSADSNNKKRVQIGNLPVGGGSDAVTSYADISTNAQSAMGASAIEDRIGEVTFDGGSHSTVTFECLVTPTFATTGTVSVRLYDVGPVAGPPTVGRLVATLATTTSGGPQRLTQTLTVVASGPGTNDILDSDRMYQATVEVDATTGDDCYVGSVSLVGVGGGSVAVASDTTAIHENVAAEISAITAKGTPTTSDFLLIEDAADSNNKKSITIGNLPSGGGGADGRGFAIVIGNSLEGDTSDICDYLDVGDGVQLKAGIQAAAGKPVYIRPGTYDFNNGSATSNQIVVPTGTRVIGAGMDAVTIRALDASTESELFQLQGGGTRLEEFEVSIPTPTATITSSSSYAWIYDTNVAGGTSMRRVRVLFEDNGWSTLADNNYPVMDYLIYSQSSNNLSIKKCEFIDVPNKETTPALQQMDIQLLAAFTGFDVFDFSDNIVSGSNLTLEFYSDYTKINNNVFRNVAYDYIIRVLSGISTQIHNNVLEIVADTSTSQYAILILGFSSNSVSILGNKPILTGTTHANTTAFDLDHEVEVGGNDFTSGSVWEEAIVFDSSVSGTCFGNYFGDSRVDGAGVDNVVFSGNLPPVGIGTGVESNIWYNPISEGLGSGSSSTSREFGVDSSVAGSSPIIATGNVHNLTTNSAGSFSANTVDAFDTTFNSGSAVRYTESPFTRRSWAFLQAPASGDEFMIYWPSFRFYLTVDQLVVARLKFLQRLTPVAGDARIGVMLMNRSSFQPEVNNILRVVLSDTTGGNLVASFEKIDLGTPSIIGSTADVGASGQALEYAAIFRDYSALTYHGFVGTAGGNWIYLGSTTMAFGSLSLQYGGIYLQNSSVVAPGVAVGAVDYLRTYNTSNFLF